MGLITDEKTTKYMLITCDMINKKDLIIKPYTFEHVEDLKYLEVNLNYKNNIMCNSELAQ